MGVDNMRTVVYTDGACSGNPGAGGWGFFISEPELVVEGYGYEPATTNNRMEMMAAIRALEVLADVQEVEIISDSNLLIQGASQWMYGWHKKGWSKPGGLKNADLWKMVYDLTISKDVKWTWVKGHSTSIGNNRADELARGAIAKKQQYVVEAK